jgi:hypothetical protein
MIGAGRRREETPSNAARRGLIFLLLFQGGSAAIGGYVLVSDPSGAAIGLPSELLQGSVFRDYLVPGLVLLIVLGAGPLLVAYGVWTRRRWASLASFFVGCALVVWIGAEILVVGFHADPPLELVYGLIGLAIVLLAYSMSRKKQ